MKFFAYIMPLLFTLTAQAECCNMQSSPPPSPSPPAAPSPVSLPAAAPQGALSFCLYELPVDENGRRKWINLGIVQYVELRHGDVRIYYGGGNFGGGYEERMPVANAADGQALIDHMRQTAAACR